MLRYLTDFLNRFAGLEDIFGSYGLAHVHLVYAFFVFLFVVPTNACRNDS